MKSINRIIIINNIIITQDIIDHGWNANLMCQIKKMNGIIQFRPYKIFIPILHKLVVDIYLCLLKYLDCEILAVFSAIMKNIGM